MMESPHEIMEASMARNTNCINRLKRLCTERSKDQPTMHVLPVDDKHFMGYVISGPEVFSSIFPFAHRGEALEAALENAMCKIKDGEEGDRNNALISLLVSDNRERKSSLSSQNKQKSTVVGENGACSSGESDRKKREMETNNNRKSCEDFETMIERIVAILKKYSGPVNHKLVRELYNKEFEQPLPEEWLDFVRNGADEIEVESVASLVLLSLKRKTPSDNDIMRGRGAQSNQAENSGKKQPSVVAFKREVAQVREYSEELPNELGLEQDRVHDMRPSPSSSSTKPVWKERSKQESENSKETNEFSQRSKEAVPKLTNAYGDLKIQNGDRDVTIAEQKHSNLPMNQIERKENRGQADVKAVEISVRPTVPNVSPEPKKTNTVDGRGDTQSPVRQKEDSPQGVTIRSALLPCRTRCGEFQAYVVFAPDPVEFSVIMENLRPMDRILHDMISTDLTDISGSPSPGCLYAAYDSDRKQWVRVHLCNKQGKVFLVDFGHYSLCSLKKELKELPDSTFAMREMMAIKCCLKGILAADSGDGQFFSDTANAAFAKRVLNTTLTLRVVGEAKEWKRDEAPILPLIQVEAIDASGKNLAEWMVEEGHARWL